jgi:hypothetical protein
VKTTRILLCDGPERGIVRDVLGCLKYEAVRGSLYRDTGEVRKDCKVYKWVGKAELRRNRK